MSGDPPSIPPTQTITQSGKGATQSEEANAGNVDYSSTDRHEHNRASDKRARHPIIHPSDAKTVMDSDKEQAAEWQAAKARRKRWIAGSVLVATVATGVVGGIVAPSVLLATVRGTLDTVKLAQEVTQSELESCQNSSVTPRNITATMNKTLEASNETERSNLLEAIKTACDLLDQAKELFPGNWTEADDNFSEGFCTIISNVPTDEKVSEVTNTSERSDCGDLSEHDESCEYSDLE